MAKIIPRSLELDKEVAGLIKRIGALNHPENYIRSYNVHRVSGDVTLVTVTFIADEQFSHHDHSPVRGEEA